MANLYSRIVADDTKLAAREAHGEVWATVETWGERIVMLLSADGTFSVRRGPKTGPTTVELATGTLDVPADPRRARGR